MLINKNIRNRKYNQVKLQKDPQPLQHFIDNPFESIDSLNKSHKNVLNLLNGIRNNHVIVSPSVDLIAKKTNLSPKRVYEIIKDLEDWGFLNKIYDHLKSNIYILSSWFSSAKVREQLRGILWSLRYIIITPYLSTFFNEKDLRIEKCRQYYNNIFLLKNNNNIDNIIKNDILYCKSRNAMFSTCNLDKTNRSPNQNNFLNNSLEFETMTDFIKNLGGFNEVAKIYLTAYPEIAIRDTIKKIQKKSGLSGNAFPYFKAILEQWCKENNKEANWSILEGLSGRPTLTLPIITSSLFDKSADSTKSVKTEQTTKPFKRELPKYPVPMWHLTIDENVDRLKKYYDSPEVLEYKEHHGDAGKTMIAEICIKFSTILNTHTKENIISWYNNLITMFGDIETAQIARKNYDYLSEIPIQTPTIETGNIKNFLDTLIKNSKPT